MFRVATLRTQDVRRRDGEASSMMVVIFEEVLVPHWVLKALVQKGLSYLPNSQAWNRVFQRYVTKSLCLTPAAYQTKLMECRKHLESYFRGSSYGRIPGSVFEVGTGWFPIIPLGFYLCGVSRIWTYDVTPLLRADAVQTVARRCLEYAASGDLFSILPWVRDERLAEVRRVLGNRDRGSAVDILEQWGIHARVGDARDTRLEESSMEFITSNITLQYVEKEVLRGIFAEFRRIASINAVMSHNVSIADDYAVFDRAITPYNFLRYSSSAWRLFKNSFSYQNRLRPSDYRALHQSAGFRIIWEECTKGSPQDLDRIRIAEEFQRYPREELLVLRAWMVSIPVRVV